MKKHTHMNPLLAATVAACLAIPAYASAPSTSAEAKDKQPTQVAKGKHKSSKKKGGAA
jgi:hypothetical protein